ncbi:hypothetical protein D3C79_924520 [compost metagenome]
MPGCSGRDRLGGHGAVGRDQRRDQAALATSCQDQSFVQVIVGHQRADRAKGLDIVGAAFGMRVSCLKQGWGEERTLGNALATWGETVAGAEQLIAALKQGTYTLADIALLVMRGQGPHANAVQ